MLYTVILLYSDYLFKMLLIGNSGVGKSCLLVRYAVSQNQIIQIFEPSLLIFVFIRKIHSMKTSSTLLA